MEFNNIKATIIAIGGILGSWIAQAFGGWTEALFILMGFMAIDYITGLCVAGFWQKSTKSEHGGLTSKECRKGIIKKFVTLLLVIMATQLDVLMNTSYIGDAVIIAFVINESISILENAGLMGLPIPSILTKAIDILKNDKQAQK